MKGSCQLIIVTYHIKYNWRSRIVKVLTEKGAELYSDWDYGWSGSRWDQLGLSEQEVHERLWKNAKYSHIPHYAREVFGCKTR